MTGPRIQSSFEMDFALQVLDCFLGIGRCGREEDLNKVFCFVFSIVRFSFNTTYGVYALFY